MSRRLTMVIPRADMRAEHVGIAACDCGCGDIIVSLHGPGDKLLAAGRLSIAGARSAASELIRCADTLDTPHQIGRG